MAKADASASLSPLPPDIHRGISFVTGFAFLSMISTAALFAHLTWRLTTWKHRGYARANQYVALLINLIAADLIQATGFVLEVEWVSKNAITVQTPTCWTQGWLLNAGDVGSAVFTFAMAVHLFMDIILDKRMPYYPFLTCIVLGWIFNFFCATIGIILHPHDFYMRAGMWCWINEHYMPLRLWLHYTWILVTEFGVVTIYSVMLVILWRRVRSLFYSTSDLRLRAQSAVKSILLYPLVYVICTLPAVVTRLKIMTGGSATIPEFTLLGVMLVSNGWLDVLLYTITRSSLIFGPAVPDDDVYALETFTRFRPDHEGHGQRFSTMPVSPTKTHHEVKWPTTTRTSVIGSDSDAISPNSNFKRESFASFEKRFEFDLDGIPKRPAEATTTLRRDEKKRRRRSYSGGRTPTPHESPLRGSPDAVFDELDSMMTRLPLLIDKRSVKRRSSVMVYRSVEVLVPWKSNHSSQESHHREMESLDLDRSRRRLEAAEMRRALNWMIRNDEKMAGECPSSPSDDHDKLSSPVDFTEKG